jgi:hypothetical protein
MKGGFNLAKLCENRWVRLVLLAVVVYLAYNYFFVKREGAENLGFDYEEKPKAAEDEEGEEVQEPAPAEEPAAEKKDGDGFRNLTAWA